MAKASRLCRMSALTIREPGGFFIVTILSCGIFSNKEVCFWQEVEFMLIQPYRDGM